MSIGRPRLNIAAPAIIAAFTAAAHFALGFSRYRHFTIVSWDLGIFAQVVSAYSRFEAPIAEIHGIGFNVLGDHFSPSLALLAPLWWIWPDAAVLLLAQAIAFGVSTIPITRLAISRLGWLPGVSLGIAYGCAGGLIHATLVEFHEIALAVPTMAFSLIAVAECRWRAAVLYALPLLLVKEDLGFTVAAIGLLILIRGARRAGILLIFAGLVGSVLALFVFIPFLAPGHRYPYFSQYDPNHTVNSTSSIWAALAPSRITTALSTKVDTVLTWGSTTLFTSWFSLIAIVGLPTLGWRMISAQPSYWGTDWHYDALLMPIGFIAAIEICDLWKQSLSKRYLRILGAAVPIAMVVLALLPPRFSPIRSLVNADTWHHTDRQEASQNALSVIPDGATVLTDLGLMSHLAARTKVYWIADADKILPDYIVSTDGAGWTPPAPDQAVSYWAGRYSGHQFALVFARNGVTLLHRLT